MQVLRDMGRQSSDPEPCGIGAALNQGPKIAVLHSLLTFWELWQPITHEPLLITPAAENCLFVSHPLTPTSRPFSIYGPRAQCTRFRRNLATSVAPWRSVLADATERSMARRTSSDIGYQDTLGWNRS